MPRAKRSGGGSDGAPLTNETRALAETLRAMASQVEADPVLAARLMTGLTTVQHAGHDAPAQPSSSAKREVVAPPLDPFAVLRQSGEQGLQEALATLDLASLKAIVRAYRLDPARIAARWTTPERIIDLIVEQAQARLNHGRAFERV